MPQANLLVLVNICKSLGLEDRKGGSGLELAVQTTATVLNRTVHGTPGYLTLSFVVDKGHHHFTYLELVSHVAAFFLLSVFISYKYITIKSVIRKLKY